MAREARQATETLHVSPVLVRKEKKAIHKLFSRVRLSAVLLWLLVLVIVAGAAYYFGRRRNVQGSSNTAAQAQQELQSVTTEVGKLMILPQGEEPTIATVSDKSKLTGQDFFKNAQNGDKILIYANAKLAIIYRPSINKIVNVAPLFNAQNNSNTNSQSKSQPVESNNKSAAQASPATNQTAPVATPASFSTQTNPQPASQNASGTLTANNPDAPNTLNVVIENGSDTPNLVQNVQNKLNGMSGVSVVSTGNAEKNNYAGILVIDLTGKNPELVLQIAQTLDGQIENLPAGETKPTNADVLIIVGSNSSSTTAPNNTAN